MPTDDMRTLTGSDIGQLRDLIGEYQCLRPGSLEYSKAVFIGNLNHRMSMPAIIVQPRVVQEVQKVVIFAKQKKVDLRVKNDLTLEGGAIWGDAYFKLLHGDPRSIIIGGQCPTVGVSGFTLGAGISPFTRSYGLGSDNVAEMTVVTADGSLVTVTGNKDEEERKRDLSWALRGGGGGNFGVLVSFKSRLHKLKDRKGRVVCGALTWDLTDGEQRNDFEEMMDTFNEREWPNELCVDALWNHSSRGRLQGGLTVIYNGSAREAYGELAPLLRYGPTTSTLNQMHWTDWVKKSEGWDPRSLVYHHDSSFIFAKGAITREVGQAMASLVQDAGELFDIADGVGNTRCKCHILWDHIGGKSEEIGKCDTPFYWREGHHVSTVKIQWTHADQTDKAMRFIAKCQTTLRRWAIDKQAAYINFIDGTVFEWEEAYYGKNYPRLQEVKSYWDPDNFFKFMQSIRPLERQAGPLAVPDEGRVPSVNEIMDTQTTKQTLDWWHEFARRINPRDLAALRSAAEMSAFDLSPRIRIRHREVQFQMRSFPDAEAPPGQQKD